MHSSRIAHRREVTCLRLPCLICKRIYLKKYFSILAKKLAVKSDFNFMSSKTLDN